MHLILNGIIFIQSTSCYLIVLKIQDRIVEYDNLFNNSVFGKYPSDLFGDVFLLQVRNVERAELASLPSAAVTAYFELPWPERNDGLTTMTFVRPIDAGLPAFPRPIQIELLSSWLQRIQNGQITIDGKVVTLSNTELRAGAELVYHRLPWREPDAPYLLEVLFEDEYLIAVNKPSGLQVDQKHISPSSSPRKGVHQNVPGMPALCKTKLGKSRLAAYFAEGRQLLKTSMLNLLHHLNMPYFSLHTYAAIVNITKSITTIIQYRQLTVYVQVSDTDASSCLINVIIVLKNVC
ncbi:hypothetical protein HAX54_014081 [Datura stramonium]|uniref:Pseudouridine synthase RsuA/RluA-like domain-containing protein n=1 Tax=Datura stramonium TaxID=4076 RepID=A0ABS8TQA6_DATST|nr:hypothetical protein [Datura stramonium]